MKETSGESHQICDAKFVSALSTDFAYLAMMLPMASTSAAAARGGAAELVFVGWVCFFAGTEKGIAVDSARRISAMSVVLRMTERIYTICACQKSAEALRARWGGVC